MKGLPRAIPREKQERKRGNRVESLWIRFGIRRIAIAMVFFACVGFIVYLTMFYRFADVEISYATESGMQCVTEAELKSRVKGSSVWEIFGSEQVRENLLAFNSCVKDVQIRIRDYKQVSVLLLISDPILAVVRLESESLKGDTISQFSAPVKEGAVFYVNESAQVLTFQTAVQLPRVYFRTSKSLDELNKRFLNVEQLGRLLQLFDFFLSKSSTAPRIELLENGDVKVSTENIETVILKLDNDIETQLQRYLYVIDYLDDQNRSVERIDVRAKWTYITYKN